MKSLQNVTAIFTKVTRYQTVNEHIPTKTPVTILEQDAEGFLVERTGCPVFKGAVWFVLQDGTSAVTFVNKSTKLWQKFRVAEGGEVVKLTANVKEFRDGEDHPNHGELPSRFVLTHVRCN